MRIRGSCLCGNVRFEIDQAIGPFELCHCRRCRKMSGAAALPAVGVNVEDYTFLSGREFVTTYAAPILHQPPAYHSMFCSNCGSPVPPPDPAGDWIEIAAGLFDDDVGLKPDKHIFVEHVPDWDEIEDSLPRYTRRELYKLRTGNVLPDDPEQKDHDSAQ